MRLQFGDCIFDSDTRELFRNGEPVHISPKAFRLLELLLDKRPKALSKAEIHKTIWPDAFVSDATLASLIKEIREAVGEAGRDAGAIRTLHGYGYAFHGTATRTEAASLPTTRIEYRLIWDDREIALAQGENLIGRDHDVAVWVSDKNTSRHHARVFVSDLDATLTDLGSKNGTFLNGRRLAGSEQLRDGDEIRIASQLLKFRSYPVEGTTATANRLNENPPPLRASESPRRRGKRETR